MEENQTKYKYSQPVAYNPNKTYRFIVVKNVWSVDDDFDAYDDTSYVACFDTEEEARGYIEFKCQEIENILEKAVKNTRKTDNPYNDLLNKFHRYVVTELIFAPEEKDIDRYLAEEEEQKMIELETDEKVFKEFMVKEGYSEEVADATVRAYDYFMCSENLANTSYRWYPVPYMIFLEP